jgi:hypothetical protein
MRARRGGIQCAVELNCTTTTPAMISAIPAPPASVNRWPNAAQPTSAVPTPDQIA